MDSESEVPITIMASLTKQKSSSLSQNVKMGIRFHYPQGKMQISHNHF